jgi:transcriptional regulator with GAF, ATPase, and Fis domain
LLYNKPEILSVKADEEIKTEKIFHIISEITEMLSLTNIPERIVDAALDTLSRALGTNCGWVQVITPGSNKLVLSAHQGFTPHIQDKMAAMDMNHPLVKDVIGIGTSVTIPDLNQDGNLGMSMFAEAGFITLIAVPIITYRVQGIMGVVYRTRKNFTKDDTDLVTAVASIMGLALNKSTSLKQIDTSRRGAKEAQSKPTPAGKQETKQPVLPESEITTDKEQPQTDYIDVYKKHQLKMRAFRNSHGILYQK